VLAFGFVELRCALDVVFDSVAPLVRRFAQVSTDQVAI
jgi:hypothetical protein